MSSIAVRTTLSRYASALDRLTGGWSGSSLIAAYLSAPPTRSRPRCAAPSRRGPARRSTASTPGPPRPA
ncbi:hypothetical protein ACFSTC_20515 [Nonomuraea ferruginea]